MPDLEHRFKHHPPKNQEALERHERVRKEFLSLAELMTELVPPGREQSLVMTKLEEAMMWANAGIARNVP